MKKDLSALSLIFLLGFTFFFQSTLQADDQAQATKIHHEIVVTATRLETPVKETASAISVIKIESLTSLKNFQPETLFSGIPGVFYLQAGSVGGAGSFFIRGANSEHTLFMIDGLEINDPISPSRSFNFNLLNLNLIDRIEILRGPQSTLYGSDALAGVVNFISCDSGNKGAELFASFGSLQTWQGAFKLSQKFGRLSYQLEVNSFNSRGISAASHNYPGNTEPDGYNQQGAAVKFKYLINDNISFSWQTRALLSRAELDDFGGPYGDDPNYTQKTRFLFNRNELNYFLFQHRWEQKLIWGLEENRRDNNNPPDNLHPDESETAFYHSRFLKLDWQNNLYFSSRQTVLFGLEYKNEKGDSSDTYISPWGTFNSNFPGKAAGLMAFYFQDVWKPWDSLSLISGFRLDHHQQFGSALTYRLAANFDWPEINTRFKATVGTGFKAPSLYQLYAPPSYYGPIGNPDLKPERNLGWDIGLEKNLSDKFQLSLTYFQSYYQNLIQFYFGSGYANVGRALSRGIEASLNFNILSGLLGQLGWTKLKALDRSNNSELLRRPRDSGFLKINYKIRRASALAELNYLGPRYDVNFSSYPPSTVKLQSALVANISVLYDLNQKAELLLQISNLFNARYELIYGYGMPGTTISTGFRLKLF